MKTQAQWLFEIPVISKANYRDDLALEDEWEFDGYGNELKLEKPSNFRNSAMYQKTGGRTLQVLDFLPGHNNMANLGPADQTRNGRQLRFEINLDIYGKSNGQFIVRINAFTYFPDSSFSHPDCRPNPTIASCLFRQISHFWNLLGKHEQGHVDIAVLFAIHLNQLPVSQKLPLSDARLVHEFLQLEYEHSTANGSNSRAHFSWKNSKRINRRIIDTISRFRKKPDVFNKQLNQLRRVTRLSLNLNETLTLIG